MTTKKSHTKNTQRNNPRVDNNGMQKYEAYVKECNAASKTGEPLPREYRSGVAFLLAQMKKQGAISRASAIDWNEIQKQAPFGSPGFGYHTYAGSYSDGSPLDELTDVAMLHGLIAGYGSSDEWGHKTHYWAIEANKNRRRSA